MSDSPNTKKRRVVVDDGDCKVACIGGVGSLTHIAASKFFESFSVALQPNKSMTAVADSVWALKDPCSYGVIPAESSSGGVLSGVYKNLISGPELDIVAEFYHFDELCWVSKVPLTEVQSVLCHQHLLETCSEFLDSVDQKRIAKNLPRIERICVADSAFACDQASKCDQPNASYSNSSAIASKTAAQKYSLDILQQNVSNDKNAETRYIVLSKPNEDPLKLATDDWNQEKRKTSVAIALKHEAGALFKMTSCFALRDIDIIKIESVPGAVAVARRDSIGTPTSMPREAQDALHKHWSMVFMVDFETPNKAAYNSLLRNLQDYSIWIRGFGTYSTGLKEVVRTEPSAWSTMLDNGVLAL